MPTWKNALRSIHLLILVILLSSCSAATPAVHNEAMAADGEVVLTAKTPIPPTQTPTATSTPTQTATPKPSPTATWTFSELSTYLLDLYENNAGCRLPCWWGIEPGETTWESAQEVLAPAILEVNPPERAAGGTMYEVQIQSENPEINHRHQTYTVKRGVVESIEVGIYNLFPYADLSYLFQSYGQPDEIWVETSRRTETQEETYFFLVVFYRELGILGLYWDPTAIIENDMVNACLDIPNPGINMRVWAPDSEITIFEAVQSTDLIVDKPLRPLQEVSDLSVEAYYLSVLVNGAPPCITTPLQLWEER
jgi:hypothetical protein